VRTSVTKRLGVVTALVLCLAAAACSSDGGGSDAPADRAKSLCTRYIEAYDAHDDAQIQAVVGDIITLAREQQDPNTAQPGMQSLIAATVLSAGPLPWQPNQYNLLRQSCVAYIATADPVP
jgi:hypothetical protein